MILLHGALAKSKFAGLESQDPTFMICRMIRNVTAPWEPLCLTLFLQNYFNECKKTYLWGEIY